MNYYILPLRSTLRFARIIARVTAALFLLALGTYISFADHTSPKDMSTSLMAQDLTQRTWPGRADPKDKGAQPWLFKDWTKWNLNDCGLVLSNSPWSHRTEYNPFAGNGQGYKETVVQLGSALPVRQALLRNLQLQKHYDRMDAQKKHEFDQQHPSELSDLTTQKVFIIISNSSYQPPLDPNSQGPSAPFYAPDPPTQVALSLSDGTLLQPIQTNVSAPSVGIDLSMNRLEYVFPRTVSGKPLYSTRDSLLAIYLGAPLILDKKTGKIQEQTGFRNSRKAYEFKIADLMYKGNVEY
jgi:hypothetical protein